MFGAVRSLGARRSRSRLALPSVSRQASPELLRARELVGWWSRIKLLNRFDTRYLTGNALASMCRHSLNYGRLKTNPGGRENWWFVKVDFVERFFERLAPDTPFVLVTHNGDRPIDASCLGFLDHPELLVWFSSNVALTHQKLVPVPIGLANSIWPHGDTAIFDRVIAAGQPKSQLVDVSFSIGSNPAERTRCLDGIGLSASARLPFPQYLERLSMSYFCVSPAGNGLDCHRTWEALVVGAVPIVISSCLTEELSDLPWIVLDDWSQFSALDLSPRLYASILGSRPPVLLSRDPFGDRMLETVSSRARSGEPGRRTDSG